MTIPTMKRTTNARILRLEVWDLGVRSRREVQIVKKPYDDFNFSEVPDRKEDQDDRQDHKYRAEMRGFGSVRVKCDDVTSNSHPGCKG